MIKIRRDIPRIPLLITITLLVLFVVYFTLAPKDTPRIGKDTVLATPSSPNQTFNLTTIKGEKFRVDLTLNQIKIEKMSKKIVFLKIFGWDCHYCKEEIAQLINLKKELGTSFDVIAIESQRHSLEENEKFSKKYGVNYHIVMGEKYQRLYGYFIEHYNWSGVIPLSIVIGDNGKVLAFETGYKSYSLAELLKTSIIKGEKND